MTTSRWRKSSRSANNGACVEARLSDDAPELSDSKLADDRPILQLDANTYGRFLALVKSGDFDLK